MPITIVQQLDELAPKQEQEKEAPVMATPAKARLKLVEGSRFAKDLMLVRTIIRCPEWAVKAKGATMTLGGEEVKGKHSSGTLQFNIDPKGYPIFQRIRENGNLIENTIKSYTVVDAEDGYRLVSMYKRTEFLARLTELNAKRMKLADWLDENFESMVVPLIQQEHPKHFEYLRPRLPVAPFGPRLELEFRLRPVGALGPDEIDPAEWENLSPEAREQTIRKMLEEADKLAKARAEAIINGAMAPIVDLALEIQGKKPNPKFDPEKPESSKNLRYLPGINSGHKKMGFLDNLAVNLERIINFRQYMSDDVLAQADAALAAVRRVGGNVTLLNSDGVVQDAIKKEMAQLSALMQSQINTNARRERSVGI